MSGRLAPKDRAAKRAEAVKKRRAAYQKAMARGVQVLESIVREKVAAKAK